MPDPPKKPRVAVVEDNKSLLMLLRSILTVQGCKVDTFTNGAEALASITSGSVPDLVISDVQMPQMDGLSLCKALRSQHDKTRLPILMISVLSAEDDILAALEAGASDYLVKPFSVSQVKAKVTYYLQRDEQPVETGPLRTNPDQFPFSFDKFELLKPLGTGSFGTVYKAKRRSDGLLVALKLLNFGIQRERSVLGRYFREVASLARLQVPHVVRFIASGFERGRYFLVMELVQGRSAWEMLSTDGFFSPRQIARLGREMCEALAGLEAAGLVHRDIKPGNIVVKPDGSAILVDFGLAKDPGEQSGLTKADEFMGTAEYVAPEIIRGRGASIASDLYSLGATLYELASSTPPHVAANPLDVLRKSIAGPPITPLKTIRAAIHQELSDLIGELLERDLGTRLLDPVEAQRRFASLESVV